MMIPSLVLLLLVRTGEEPPAPPNEPVQEAAPAADAGVEDAAAADTDGGAAPVTATSTAPGTHDPVATDEARGSPAMTERELELSAGVATLMWFAGMGVTVLSMVAVGLTPLGTIAVAILGGMAINDIGKERTGFEGTWWTLAAAVAAPVVTLGIAVAVTVGGFWMTIPLLRGAGVDTDSEGDFGLLPNNARLGTMLGWGAVGLVVGVGVGGYMPVLAYKLTATAPQE